MAWLTDVLERIVSGKVKANALDALLPWNWRPAERVELAAAASKTSASCSFTWISYAGDEGGIVCRLDFRGEAKNAAFVSITHLRFDARLPLAREITAYQKHRVKRLQRRQA